MAKAFMQTISRKPYIPEGYEDVREETEVYTEKLALLDDAVSALESALEKKGADNKEASV